VDINLLSLRKTLRFVLFMTTCDARRLDCARNFHGVIGSALHSNVTSCQVFDSVTWPITFIFLERGKDSYRDRQIVCAETVCSGTPVLSALSKEERVFPG
jgi:hypothetical protein